MLRLFNIVLVATVIATATWTYGVKHDAEARLNDIAELERQIETEREVIDLLGADWAVLSHPSRLQRLSDQYQDDLQLQVTRSSQIVGPSELPDEPVRDASQGIADILAGEANDDLTTGSINGGGQ